MRISAVLIAAAALVLGGTAAANASPAGNGTCYGGEMSSAVYSNLTVTGDCYLGDGAYVQVLNNVSIAPYASLDATRYSTSTLKVGNNVSAGRGAEFAMGCSEHHPCGDGGSKAYGQDSVKNSVSLYQVFNAAINNAVIGNDLSSVGGGAGLNFPGFIPFSVKDDRIGGNLSVTGLRTVWFGIVRTQVGGNVLVQNDQGSDPDSNEVITNRIGGNLACYGNWPHAQYGDAIFDPINGPNVVRGNATGECAVLVGRPR